MTASTPTVVPEASASGTAPAAEPTTLQLSLWRRSPDITLQALGRAAEPDFEEWLRHVQPAAGCTRPIRLAGAIRTIDTTTGAILSTQLDTAGMPDGVIYKPCGNRRHSACPSCSARYKRDAYFLIRTGLLGGKGAIPETVAQHPAVFPTLTAPSFGPVHTRVIHRHTCSDRRRCDCRPEPCHPRRDQPRCEHGQSMACFARHTDTDTQLGTPLCLDCYDHVHQVVWNLHAGELWRRTRIAIERRLHHVAESRGVDPASVKLSYGKAAEMQRRGVAHFHAIVRLDGADPTRPGVILVPAGELGAQDLVDAIAHAARHTTFTTDSHLDRPGGWVIGWGEQLQTRVISIGGPGEVTDSLVAAYLAKYATKSTEITGHISTRLNRETVTLYADPHGTHTERLIHACWHLGRYVPGLTFAEQPVRPYAGLRRWAHMLGFGGHFLTKSRHYSITFGFLRAERAQYRNATTTGPEADGQADDPTVLVVNFLQFVGAGWHTAGDALLANTSAALARDHHETARTELAALAA